MFDIEMRDNIKTGAIIGVSCSALGFIYIALQYISGNNYGLYGIPLFFGLAFLGSIITCSYLIIKNSEDVFIRGLIISAVVGVIISTGFTLSTLFDELIVKQTQYFLHNLFIDIFLWSLIVLFSSLADFALIAGFYSLIKGVKEHETNN